MIAIKKLRLDLLKALLIASPLMLAGCIYNEKEPSPTATGPELYQDYCASCHKANGKGRFVMGVPSVFANALSRDEVVRLIRQGDPRYPRMPVFEQIRFSQAHKIAEYLRELEANAD